MTFHIGQKVVCVDGDFETGGYGDEITPQKGCVYTLREILPHPDHARTLSCRLHEIVNCADRPYTMTDGHVGIYEVAFRITRFRPVKQTDISVFQNILAPAPKEKEPA